MHNASDRQVGELPVSELALDCSKQMEPGGRGGGLTKMKSAGSSNVFLEPIHFPEVTQQLQERLLLEAEEAPFSSGQYSRGRGSCLLPTIFS